MKENEIKLVKLRKTHNRSNFDCGHEEINRFLKQTASQMQSKFLGEVYCAISLEDEDEILGFFSMSCVEAGMSQYIKRLPHQLQPCLLLGRLGVDKDFQGYGLGTYLIRCAMRLVATQYPPIFCALIIDAKTEELGLFYQRLGFKHMRDQRWYIAMKDLRSLFD